MATHYEGPLLADRRAGRGLLEDLPLADVDRVRSRYKVWVEDFSEEFADGQLELMGATVTDVNVPTAPTEVVGNESRFMVINPGTKADAGQSVQYNVAGQNTALGRTHRMPGPIVSTVTLMDNQDMVWACRFGLATNHATGIWDGKVVLGWVTTDTSLMDTGTGAPTIATGGGLGFHIGESGQIRYFGRQTALTSATHAIVTGKSVNDSDGTQGAGVWRWYEAGFRCHWVDASAGTGSAYFWLDGRKFGPITTDLPMASTETYGVTFGIYNGPTQLSDLAIDYNIIAITGPGR